MARAPGTLDVIGEIADYSGSLVLQVNICFLIYFFIFLIAVSYLTCIFLLEMEIKYMTDAY